jgi:isopenicillin-N epimerase
LIFSTTYGCYKKILREECHSRGAVMREEQIKFPVESAHQLLDQFITKINDCLTQDQQDEQIKYIFIDYITSVQGCVLPIKEISSFCKSKRPDICIVVDAAHALGSIKDLNMKTLDDIDILFTNCHKWFCGPKGTAFLYKKRTENEGINLRPSIQSHGIDSSPSSQFIWTGLKNYSTFLALNANLDIWLNWLGGFDKVVTYCADLARKSGTYLADKWKTTVLVPFECSSTMVCIQLPDDFIFKVLNVPLVVDKIFTYNDAETIQNYLYFNHEIEAPIKVINNHLYIRVSCHIYNNFNDFIYLANCVDGNY